MLNKSKNKRGTKVWIDNVSTESCDGGKKKLCIQKKSREVKLKKPVNG